MDTVIRMRVEKSTKEPHYNPSQGKHQHSLELKTIHTSDEKDPNYIYGCLSSGSTMLIKTVNGDAVAGIEPGDFVEITVRKVQ